MGVKHVTARGATQWRGEDICVMVFQRCVEQAFEQHNPRLPNQPVCSTTSCTPLHCSQDPPTDPPNKIHHPITLPSWHPRAPTANPRPPNGRVHPASTAAGDSAHIATKRAPAGFRNTLPVAQLSQCAVGDSRTCGSAWSVPRRRRAGYRLFLPQLDAG